MKSLKKAVTILDYDAAIEEAIKNKIITKAESKHILESMRDGLEGSYWELFKDSFDPEDPDELCMSDKEADIFKRFYTFFKKYETSEDDGEFKKILFDCSAWS